LPIIEGIPYTSLNHSIILVELAPVGGKGIAPAKMCRMPEDLEADVPDREDEIRNLIAALRAQVDELRRTIEASERAASVSDDSRAGEFRESHSGLAGTDQGERRLD
jgi:hypothetical protein